MSEEVLYIVALRARVSDDQLSAKELSDAVEAAVSGEPTALAALCTVYSELSPRHNEYLRQLGFSFDSANALVTVAFEGCES